MKNIKYISLSLLITLFCIGCNISPFSPEGKQQVQNEGTIDEIKNNTQGIMAEVGKLKQNAEIQNSVIKDMQQGIINAKIGNNENSGIQILQGDGSLILIFALGVVSLILFYFYKEKQINTILINEIKNKNDKELHENIISASAYTMVEKSIYNRLYKDIS